MVAGTAEGSQLKPHIRGARPMEYLLMRAAHSEWNSFKGVIHVVCSTARRMKPGKPLDKDLESSCCFSLAFCQYFLTMWNSVVQAASLDVRRM